MDLPGIKLIVQWKANCSLCTLWQRFGRAARGIDEEAIGLLLVEKKDIVEERSLRAERAKRKDSRNNGIGTKRKATTQLQGQQTKRPALGDRVSESLVNCETTNQQREENVEIESTSLIQERREERRTHYAKQKTLTPAQSLATVAALAKPKGVEVGSSMDDYINAHKDQPGLECWRIVPMLYFGNDKTREFPYLSFTRVYKT